MSGTLNQEVIDSDFQPTKRKRGQTFHVQECDAYDRAIRGFYVVKANQPRPKVQPAQPMTAKPLGKQETSANEPFQEVCSALTALKKELPHTRKRLLKQTYRSMLVQEKQADTFQTIDATTRGDIIAKKAAPSKDQQKCRVTASLEGEKKQEFLVDLRRYAFEHNADRVK